MLGGLALQTYGFVFLVACPLFIWGSLN
jgi:hypothetical protein